jgi:hypothetical protein
MILDATRPAAELVSPSTCSPCRRRSLTTRPGLSIDADQGHGRGMILDATRAGCRQPGQPLDVLTMPATIAHHAAGCRSKRTR